MFSPGRRLPHLRLAVLVPILAAACTPTPPPACPPGAAPPASSQAPAAAAPFRVLPEESTPVGFDRMTAYPEPGWNVPRAITFSPDRKSVAYLAGESGGQQMALFAFDLEKKASRVLVRASDLLPSDKPMSREEELRRERQRQRSTGITSYQWAREGGGMLIPQGGDLFFRDATGKIERLTRTEEPEIDAKICRSGQRVMFVRGRELFALDVATKKEIALTKGAPPGVTHGQSDFNGQEELDEPSGYWPSPNCDKVAYLEVDERPVATHPVLGYRGKAPDLMEQRYPAAGAKNPVVRLGILDVASRRTTWVTLPPGKGAGKDKDVEKDKGAGKDKGVGKDKGADGGAGEERYLGRVHWAPDGGALFFQALDRDQKRVVLHRADPKTGVAAELAVESSPAWIELLDVRLLEKAPSFVWVVPRGGHDHLEVRDRETGKLVVQLTKGDWDVTSVQAIDEERRAVYFTATKESPVERRLYRVSLDGGEPARLTPERGFHTALVSPPSGAIVDIHSARDRAPQAVLRDLSGAVTGSLPVEADADMASLRLRPQEIVTVRSPSGDTLYGALLPPREVRPGERHPVVVMVYGGPHAQTVLDRWAPNLFWQHLADRGFVVFQLDNRGSAGRGPAFEQAIANRLGVVELADQLAGVEYLKTLPYVDPARIGIYGHSYGGFMAAYALFQAPQAFKAAVAASPVTEWQLYDTGYTERYMGTPQSNAAGYAGSDLTRLVKGLRGKLLVVHALMDENVHFQHTADLIDALVAENKPFDLLVYPGERHGYRSPAAKRYALRRVASYFADNL